MPNSYLLIGSVYAHGLGQLGKAVPWFERAAQLDPGNPTYSLALAGSHLDLGNVGEAGRWLEDAVTHGAEYQDVATVEALTHLYEDDLSATERIAKKVLEINPRNPNALNMLGIVAERTGRKLDIRTLYVDAFPELSKSVPPLVDASNARSAVDFAGLLLREGDGNRWEELLDRSERIIRSSQRMGWEGYGLLDVQVHALRGDRAKALAALQEATTAGWRSFGWRYYRDFEPTLASIRDEPQFESVFAQIEEDLARQREALAARPPDAPLDLPQSR